MRRLIAVLLAVAAASPALAQQPVPGGASSSSEGDTIGSLVAEGYQIRAAVPNADSFVLFLQKGTKAYACEFSTVRSSRCEQIN